MFVCKTKNAIEVPFFWRFNLPRGGESESRRSVCLFVGPLPDALRLVFGPKRLRRGLPKRMFLGPALCWLDLRLSNGDGADPGWKVRTRKSGTLSGKGELVSVSPGAISSDVWGLHVPTMPYRKVPRERGGLGMRGMSNLYGTQRRAHRVCVRR